MTRNVSRRCDTASLRARRSPDASWRAALRISALDVPVTIGSAIAVTSAMMARTTRISIKVSPRERRIRASVGAVLLCRGDILVRTFAAFLGVRAERDDVVGTLRAGRHVLVLVAPGVLGDRALLPVRAVPVVGARRRRHERLQ